MSFLRVPITCPICAGDLTPVAAAVPDRLTAKATCVCDDCRREWLIAVSLSPVNAKANARVCTDAKRSQLAQARGRV